MLNACKRLVCRKGLSNEEWRNYRRQGIGGSDAGAIAGLNHYDSAFTVYYDKVGQAAEKEENELMRQGTDLEEYVAKRFTERTGKKVQNCNYILQSKKYPFMFGDVDRVIVGENALLECKTTRNYDGYDFSAGEYPSYWGCQAQHYMAVTGADKVYLAVLEFGKGFYIIEIPRDENDINALIEIERRFWEENVLKGIPPAPDGSDGSAELINAKYSADETLPNIDLTGYTGQLERLSELKCEISNLTEEKSAIENALKEALGNATVGNTDRFKVTWKNRTSSRLDCKRLKAELPDIYEYYVVTNESRTFLFSEIK